MTEPDKFGDDPFESFSDSYKMVKDVDVVTWSQDECAMPLDLFQALVTQFGDPLYCRVGGIHYCFKPEHGIPANTAVVPQHNHKASDPSGLLVNDNAY